MLRPAILAHTSIAILIRRLFVAGILLATSCQLGWAQTTSLTDGATPLGLAPGSPAGSYALSGFDTVNPYNGNLNFRLPLLGVVGRGGASYPIMLQIDRRWRVERDYWNYPSGYTDYPNANDWGTVKPGYGPGVLQGRQVAMTSLDCSVYGYGQWYQDTLTRLTFIAADGTEYELRDQNSQGSRLYSPCLTFASRGTVFVTADGSAATFIGSLGIAVGCPNILGSMNRIHPMKHSHVYSD